MFKAKKKNPKQKRTFRKKDESDEEDNDTSNEESQTIEKIKKKRKLLTELQFKKGTDAASLLKARTNSEDDDETLQQETTVTTASSSQEGIMEQKHKQALEQYVESKLAELTGDKSATTNAKKVQIVEQALSNNQNKKLTKDELYSEIAQACEAMVGRSHNASDGDVGTGGAMLVAGTGLAEVVLPVEERLKAVQATEEAQGPRKKENYGGMPTSQVPVPGGAVGRFQVLAVDRHRHLIQDSGNANNNNEPNAAETLPPPEEEGLDRDRLGFDASRGKTVAASGGETGQGGDSNREQRNRASDDKVYGNFLKHHRENQWRGGK